MCRAASPDALTSHEIQRQRSLPEIVSQPGQDVRKVRLVPVTLLIVSVTLLVVPVTLLIVPVTLLIVPVTLLIAPVTKFENTLT